MDAALNSSHPQHVAEITSSSPADSVVSAMASVLGNVNGWTLLITALAAIIAYDQGTVATDVG